MRPQVDWFGAAPHVIPTRKRAFVFPMPSRVPENPARIARPQKRSSNGAYKLFAAGSQLAIRRIRFSPEDTDRLRTILNMRDTNSLRFIVARIPAVLLLGLGFALMSGIAWLAWTLW